MLRETFGPTGQKVTRESKKLETVERHDFHCWSDIIGVISLMRMGGAGHVARGRRTYKAS